MTSDFNYNCNVKGLGECPSVPPQIITTANVTASQLLSYVSQCVTWWRAAVDTTTYVTGSGTVPWPVLAMTVVVRVLTEPSSHRTLLIYNYWYRTHRIHFASDMKTTAIGREDVVELIMIKHATHIFKYMNLYLQRIIENKCRLTQGELY